ncbi:MAG: CapA family protein [Acidobacteriota bacterium]
MVPVSIAPPRAAGAGPDAGAAGGAVITALGDLMLAGEWDEVSAAGGRQAMAEALEPLGSLCRFSDCVFANLEATAPGDGETIVKEPRLVGSPETLSAALEALEVDLVSLANNHTFDALLSGYQETLDLLASGGVLALGAGLDAESAAEARVMTLGGLRFGWLAYNHRETRPSHTAAEESYGVNDFTPERSLGEIAELAQQVDHVVVSLHWGVEYCHVPSPASVETARRLIDAGARLVIGHHAHVVQGVEAYGEGVIAYNLGNALTTDLEIGGRLAIHQAAKNRSSFALRATFGPERLERCELLPFYAARGRIDLESPVPARLLRRANRRLAAGISERRWRRIRLVEDVVLRTLKKLHPRVVGSVRPHHFVKFFKNLRGAAGGSGPAA